MLKGSDTCGDRLPCACDSWRQWMPFQTYLKPTMARDLSGLGSSLFCPQAQHHHAKVTPDGYAQMTYMLNSVSQGKLLVVLEGGYNLRSISSSAIAVIKVLLGDKPTCEMNDIQPSRLGLQTVLEVLNIQLKFWPILKSNHDKLQLQWDLMSPPKKKKEMRRRRNLVGPLWWQWSSKRLVYIQLYGKMRRRNLCQSSSIKSLA